ncbi:MAG: toll/interleukin-1 receptor domain-containing protein, partial [bacterium]|nr:toll/interleukin-1 receptor domain-containing protein [bacterium]
MSTRDHDPNTDDKPVYDVFISHRSLNKPWVVDLARNLEARGYRVFLDEWALVPGRPFVDGLYDGVTQARKGILVATPEAVDSGWVRIEYETMLKRSLREPEFHFVPLVFGELPELPFLDNVQCVDFRDPAPEAYRRAFYRLLCGLEDRAPGPDGTVDGGLEIPEPIRPPSLPPAAETSEQRFLDQIFDTLATHPILLLLAQADCDRHHVIADLAARAAASYGEADTLLVTPPWSRETELDQYFARLGRQCRFEEEIGSAADWDDALDLRLSRGERFFLLVTGFENGSEAGRGELAGTLRSLNERHGPALRVVLCGG